MIVLDRMYLTQLSLPVSSAEEAKEIAKQLLEEVKNHPDAVGLAAIQIGIPKRVFIARRDFGLPFETWVNPILELDKEAGEIEYIEGCLSFPGQQVATHRSRQVKIFHQDIDTFVEKEDKIFGIEAVVLQHEYDHLEGILMFDRGERLATLGLPKIGRNESCPCGSGKKFKRCCG